MGRVSRRAFLQVAAAQAAVSVVACSGGGGTSATGPAGFGATSAPTETDAARAATAMPVEAAGQKTATATAGRAADWEREWAEVVAAATAEGRLSLLTWAETWGGVGYPRVVERFQQAFPGIVVERFSESVASVWLGAARQGRRNGGSAFDVALVQPDAALRQGRPEGMWAPVRPLLVRPDVVDDGVWRGGYQGRFLDAGGELCFAWEHLVLHAYAVNANLVGDGEIGSVRDLLAPKWRGQVISSDPRLGLALHSAAAVAKRWGSDVLRELLVEQRPAFSVGGRHLAEGLVQGRYPVALGVRPKALTEFREQGLAGNVRFLDLPDADFAATTSLLYFDRAPHPAAARLFANWILTQEGQAVLTSSLPANSARIDVAAADAEGTGTDRATYYEPDREANYQHTADTQRLVRGLLGAITLAG
jgi:iron(III) transport system substrate-binding protein